MSSLAAVPLKDGFSVLDASLAASLSDVGAPEVADLLAAGYTAADLVRMVAVTPPFSSVLAERIQQHLLTVLGQ
jgi:hypothetical protein